MKTREQIISEIVQFDGQDREKHLVSELGQGYLDERLSERAKRFIATSAELEKRLTEKDYLTCEDFDHFDVDCCDTCHTCYLDSEMWIVVLSDGRHAWVCDSVEQILMRRTKTVPSSPEQEKKLKLLAEIFGGSGNASHTEHPPSRKRFCTYSTKRPAASNWK